MGLYITNFSIPEEGTAYCTSLLDFSVDVLDDVYTVTLSGTYMTNNGESVPYITTPISNGYRLTYSTLPSGSMFLEVFGSNDNGDFTNDSFLLQYGYEVIWNEVVVWPLNKEIPVSITADNGVFNKNTVYFSTFFKTGDYKQRDLNAFVSVEGSGQYNVAADIRPQSKYFIYGKTYSITISGIKDYAGNELPAKTFTFTLEDKPDDNI